MFTELVFSFQIYIICLYRSCNFEPEVTPREIDAYESEYVNLQCKVEQEENRLEKENLNWNRCIWTRLADQSSCTFNHVKQIHDPFWELHQTCNNNNELLSNIGFFGSKTLYEGKGNDICGIIIKGVTVADAGYWKCELEYYNLKAQNACMTWDAILVQVIRMLRVYLLKF